MQASFVDVPTDILERRVLGVLEIPDLAALACSCTIVESLPAKSCHLWRSLSLEAYGEASCVLHEVTAKSPLPSQDGCYAASWWRSLALGATCKAFRWSRGAAQRLQSTMKAHALLRSGAHVSVSWGELVLLVGGKAQYGPLQSGVVVVDCRNLEVRAAELALGVGAPLPRLRHAACKINAVSPGGADRVLVIGGATERSGRPPTLHSSAQAMILEVLDPGAAHVRWSTADISGQAPGNGAPLFHHTLCSYNGGSHVIAWGGDTMDFENELLLEEATLDCEQRASYVFVLVVSCMSWRRVQTSGQQPGHRSLAVGVVHGHRLIIVGGSLSPKCLRAFDYGRLASMSPHALNLHTWTWEATDTPQDAVPQPRTWFGTERRGHWLICFGGRGESDDILGDLFALNLRTLVWRTPHTTGLQEYSEAAFAASMCGGIVLGGLTAPGFWSAKSDPLLVDFELRGDESSDEESADVHFEAGELVQVRRLSARSDLNGQVGVIEGFAAPWNRWIVRLQVQHISDPVLVRPENLFKIPSKELETQS